MAFKAGHSAAKCFHPGGKTKSKAHFAYSTRSGQAPAKKPARKTAADAMNAGFKKAGIGW